MMRFRRMAAVLGAVATMLGVVGLVGAPAGATSHPYCGQAWGSGLKEFGNNAPGTASNFLTNARAGRHDCFDRLVFDLAGPVSSYRVEYVSQVTAEGSGQPVPLRGGAFLSIVLGAPAYDANGHPTYRPAHRSEAVDVTGYTTFRQVAFTGSFEGVSSFGLGVRARLPFRVLTFTGPGSGSRVIVDVSHRWV